MKKTYLIITFLLFAVLLVGCSLSPTNSEAVRDKAKASSISQYYPFKENRIYDYQGIGNEFAEQQTFFEYIEGNKAQIKVSNGGTNLIKVMEVTEEALIEVYYEAEFYHIENMISKSNEKKDILLKEPLEVGSSWQDIDGHKRSITGVDVSVETPSNTYKAIEVTTELGDNIKSIRYYAKDTGLVASIYEDENGQVKTLLASILEKPLDITIKTFYPVVEDSDIKTLYLDQKIQFHTNDKIEKIIEDLLKNPPFDDLIPVLTPGVKINTIIFDPVNWLLKIDFSSELITEMNMGSTGEVEIVKSLVNTLGTFYDVEDVYISVDGKPYESGHIGLLEGESFKVDLESIEEFK